MNVPCPSCRQPAPLELRALDYNRRITNELFRYYRCANCGLLFLDPIPDDLGMYYPNEYYAIPPTLQELEAVAESRQYQIGLVQRFVPTGRLLDIGPGHGVFARLAKNSGFNVETIELDERCCHYLRDVVGVSAIHDADPAAVLPQLPPQNVITMWHAIEHIPDPWHVLQRAAENLAPGGILLIATPNPEAFQFRLFRSRWVHLETPRHVQLLPSRLLVRRLAGHGLRPVLVTSNDPGGQMLNVYGWRASLINLSPRRLARAASWRLGWVIGQISNLAETRGFPGATYTAIFQKPHDDVSRESARPAASNESAEMRPPAILAT